MYRTNFQPDYQVFFNVTVTSYFELLFIPRPHYVCCYAWSHCESWMANKTEILWEDHNSVAHWTFSQGPFVTEAELPWCIRVVAPFPDSSLCSGPLAFPEFVLILPVLNHRGFRNCEMLHYWTFMVLYSGTCPKGIWFRPRHTAVGRLITSSKMPKLSLENQGSGKRVTHVGNCQDAPSSWVQDTTSS